MQVLINVVLRRYVFARVSVEKFFDPELQFELYIEQWDVVRTAVCWHEVPAGPAMLVAEKGGACPSWPINWNGWKWMLTLSLKKISPTMSCRAHGQAARRKARLVA